MHAKHKVLMILTHDRLDCLRLCLDMLERAEAFARFDRVVLLLNGVPARLRRFVEAYMAGDFVRALTMAEQRLSTYPDELHSLSMCGLCLAALNRPAEAAVQFQRATLIAPDEPENLVNLGNALRESGQLIAGIQALEQAVSKGASGPEIDTAVRRPRVGS